MRMSGLSEGQRAEIVRLYTTPLEDGTWVGTTTIARAFGLSAGSVRNYLLRSGVKPRTARESHAGGKRCKPVVNLPVGVAPLCKCECGERTEWNRRKKRWYAFAEGHKRPPRLPTGKSRGSPGARNGSWKGGVTPLRQRLYKTQEWRELVAAVFKRDGYMCDYCGCGKPTQLHAHHIAAFADCPEGRFDIDNLVTLCRDCHLWVHSKKNSEGLYLA